MERLAGLLLPVVILAGLAQLALGYVGIEYHLGFLAAAIAVGAAIFFRFFLPLSIGCFFGAVDVLGWPWWGGVLVVAPGLLFLIPAMVTTALEYAFARR